VSEPSKQRFQRLRAQRWRELRARVPYRRNMILAAAPGILLTPILFGAAGIAGGIVGLVLAVSGPIAYHWYLTRKAGGQARDELMAAWAGEHGWQHLGELDPPADVAFCRNREKPKAEHGFRGPMCDGLQGLIFNFTYSTYETRTRTGANGTVETYREEVKHRHTVLRLAVGDLGVDRLELEPQGLLGGLGEKLRSAFGSGRNVVVESSEFNDRFTLLVNDDADDIAVRRIFDPAMIVRCVEGRFPLATFQYERGALAFVWDDQFDVEELEEVEHRVADATPMAQALAIAVSRRTSGRP